MRLTLRTLLAYLDDTLEPEQARTIGQKVAESPVAEELIERIKRVTRRRSLSVPPVVGDTSRLDPNTVAEYLDSQLGADELSEVEQTCLDDDVYLAEVAACHQILTLMLSEPARVPPTARQRMYRLVRGRESIPYRKPPVLPLDATPEDRTTEPGLRVDRLLTYLAITAVLAIGLVVALWLAWPNSRPTRSPRPLEIASREPTGTPQPTGPTSPPANTNPEPATQPSPAPPGAEQPMPPKQDKPASLPPMPMPEPAPPEPVVAAPPKKAIDRVPVNEPSKQQQPIGQHTSTGTVLLESSPAEEPNWRIVPTKGDVLSGHWLVSLPGYRSDVKLNSGIDLVLWGNLLEFMPPEFIPMSPIESQAMIHQPAKGIEADVTLDHGRIVVKNPTANSVRVRLRFRGEVWDLTLEPKAETLIDGLVSYAPGQKFSPDDSGESPMTRLYVGVRLGKISVQIRDREPTNLTHPPGPALLGWDNKGRLEDPLPLRESLPHWSETIPNQSPASDFRTVLDALSKRMSEKNAVAELILMELSQEEKPFSQAYTAYALGAIGRIAPLVDSLDNLLKPDMRGAATLALRHWIALQPNNAKALHTMLQSKDYSEAQANVVLQLLLSFSPSDIFEKATYQFLLEQLDDPKLSIRELAFWQLAQLDPEGAKDSKYSPIGENRTPAVNRWKKRLTDGKLPPKPEKLDQNGTGPQP